MATIRLSKLGDAPKPAQLRFFFADFYEQRRREK